jgi:hypothetical protein
MIPEPQNDEGLGGLDFDEKELVRVEAITIDDPRNGQYDHRQWKPEIKDRSGKRDNGSRREQTLKQYTQARK